MVFVISDTSGKKDEASEDKANLLRGIKLQGSFPEVPLMLMLLQHESREIARSVGLPANISCAMADIKNKFFWQSCRCKGWNTLLGNLMQTLDDDEIKQLEGEERSEWLHEYLQGMGNELYGFLPKKELHGRRVADLTRQAFQRSGVCIVAAQVDGKILPAPLKRRIGPDTVLFALAQNAEDFAEWEQEGQDWEAVFSRSGRVAYDQLVGGVLSGRDKPLSLAHVEATPPGKNGISARGGDGNQVATAAAARHDYGSFAPPEEARLVELMEQKAKNIIDNAEMAPFVVLVDQSQDWQSLVPFLLQSRAAYMPYEMPIIVLSSVMPPPSIVARLAFESDPGFACIRGCVHLAHDLRRAGVEECSTIVCLGSDSLAGASADCAEMEMAAMLDAETVMLHRILQSIVLDKAVMILEFKRIQNMRLLSQSRQSKKDALPEAPRSSSSWFCWPRPGDLNPCKQITSSAHRSHPQHQSTSFLIDPRVAAGEIFSGHFLGAMLARAFYAPGIVQVMDALMGGTEDYSDDFMLPWQVRLAEEDVGTTYGDLFAKFVEHPRHCLLPIGLLRAFDVQGQKPYVWTNPVASTVLRSTDLLYVLADSNFGKAENTRPLLPLAGDRERTRTFANRARSTMMA